MFGKYISSKVGEKGTGVCGGVTILIGAFKDEKALSHIKAEMSVAMLHLG